MGAAPGCVAPCPGRLGLLRPFEGWWVRPDIPGSLAGQASFTVGAPVEWSARGSARRGEVVLTLTLREH